MKISKGAFLVALCFFTLVISNAHVPVHDPQPPPDGSGGEYNPPPDWVPPNTGATTPTGATTANPDPRAVATGSRGADAAAVNTPRNAKNNASVTRKARGRTSPMITWDQWWARNRYPYLDFPRLQDSHDRMFPLTRSILANPSASSRLDSLKQRSLHLIRPMLHEESARLRRSALTGLAMLNDEESLPDIRDRLRDANQTVRDSALLALGILRNPEARHLLLHMVKGSPVACEALDQSQVPDYFRGFAEIALALEDARGVQGLLQSVVFDAKAQPQVRAM
ncbi:MAG: HEAT repeat domain-containing protein, partial [Planctomycetota bacterium]